MWLDPQFKSDLCLKNDYAIQDGFCIDFVFLGIQWATFWNTFLVSVAVGSNRFVVNERSSCYFFSTYFNFLIASQAFVRCIEAGMHQLSMLQDFTVSYTLWRWSLALNTFHLLSFQCPSGISRQNFDCHVTPLKDAYCCCGDFSYARYNYIMLAVRLRFINVEFIISIEER